MRRVLIAIIIISLLDLGLTFGLRGAVPPQTIRVVDLKNNSLPLGESDAFSTIAYNENFTGWYIGYESPNVNAQVNFRPGSIVINGTVQPSQEYSSVAVFKHVNISLAESPILEASLKASSGINYGFRFYSKYPNGTTLNLWWEGSPLDHRPGSGQETIRANLEYQARLVTGHFVDSLSYLEVYVEAAPGTARNFIVSIDRYDLRSDPLIPLESRGSFRAAYINIDGFGTLNSSWELDKAHLGVTIRATSDAILEMFLVQGSEVYSSLIPPTYVYSPLNQYNEFTLYPEHILNIFPDLLPPSGSSLVLLAKTGAIQAISIDSADLVYLPIEGSRSEISAEAFSFDYAYMITFLFGVPVTMAIFAYWRFFPRASFGRRSALALGAVGFLCRIAIAPIAAHRFDMDVFLASARGWFQFGSTSGSIGPTLPLTFLMYWIPYSFYALFQVLGFHDVFLPTHHDGIVEGEFIRLFPFAADALVFFVLLRLKNDGKSLVWATFYLLNPLVIYVSAVWGQYDGAAMAAIALGVYWLARGRVGRAGLAFIFSGMLQLLGFIPYAVTLIRTAFERKYSTAVILIGVLSLILVYRPEALLLYLLLLSAMGATRSLSFSVPGLYTVLGNIPATSFVSNLHPLMISLVALATIAIYFTFRGKMTPSSTILITGLVSIALLSFSNILAGWVWVIPATLVYASLSNRDGLGVFSLVFGTNTGFTMMSYTIGSRYVLTGDPNFSVVPAIELVSNSVQIFAVSVSLSTFILLFLMLRGKGNANRTFVITSAFAFLLDLALMIFGGVKL